jgi:arylsulfatase A-like enzyme
VILALGAGVQLSRLLAGRRQLAARVPVVTALLAVLILAAGGTHHGRLALQGGPRSGAQPPRQGDSPNVLLIVLDTVRAQSLSAYGYERPTSPTLERIAAEGATFDLAISSSSWTLPSHGSMLTGGLPADFTADWEVPLGPTPRTLAEFFTDRGYAASAFVANLYYLKEFWGIDRGFPRWDDHPVSWAMMAQNEWFTSTAANKVREVAELHREFVSKPAAEVRRDFVRWLDRTGPQPFFAMLNFFDAHLPYGPIEPHTPLFAQPGDRYWLDNNTHAYTPDELAELTDSYDSAIRHVDYELAVLFEELSRRNVLDDTVVIITSDHGEEFGEHDPRLLEHGNSLYIQSIRVPLMIRYPQTVPPGVRVPAPVSIADIPATILDLIGASPTEFPGHSLAGQWRDDGHEVPRATPAISELSTQGEGVPFHPVSKGHMRSIVAGSMHYIIAGEEHENLFDLASDPQELHDLAADPLWEPELDRMRRLLEAVQTGENR